MTVTITCAVEGCTDEATEHVHHETEDGTVVKIPTCMNHVSTVGFGLETANNAPEPGA